MCHFLQGDPKREFMNPTAQYRLTKQKVIFIALNASFQKITTRKNEIYRVILLQVARLQHNRVNLPLLQNNVKW